MAKDASNYGRSEHPRENWIFEDVTLQMNQTTETKSMSVLAKTKRHY